MIALGPSLSDRHSHGLWSLWEMMEFKIKPFLDIQDVLVQWSMLLHNRPEHESIDRWRRDEFSGQLAPLMPQLATEEFVFCRRGVERLLETLDKYDDSTRIVSAVDDLRRRLLDQAEMAACLSLSAKEREFYEPAAPLFGARFQANFASGGAFELDEAAKCLALGRPTAAVFHLMRMMEFGVRAVAKCLSIPDPVQPADRSWGAVLKRVRDGIDGKWPTVALRDSGDGAVFDALHASLDAVKNPWRNSTMHPANKYTDEEGRHVFDAVRGFMMRLADRCDESGEPKA